MTALVRSVCSGLLVVGVVLAPIPAAAGTEEPQEQPPGPHADSFRRGEAYTHLMRALLSVRKGEVATAVGEIHRALELEPESPELLVESAELLLQWTGRVGEAEELARRALRLDPDDPGALRFLAELAAARALGPDNDPERLTEAIELFERVVAEAVEPDAEALWTMTQLYLNSGDMAAAVESAREIVRLRPGDLRAAQTLAQLLMRSERGSEALTVLLEYAAGHPMDDGVLGWMEQLATTHQSWNEVARVLGSGAPYSGEAGGVQHLYGQALLRLGRMDEAVEALETARNDAPEDRGVRKDLALAYRGLGRLADAAALFFELTEEAPEFPFLHQLLAETLAEQRDFDGALAAYHRALDGLGSEADAAVHRDAIRQRIVLLHMSRDELDASRAMMDQLEIGGGILALEIHARLALASNDLERAREYARRLAAADREGQAALIEGEAFVLDKRWNKAEARFEQAMQKLPMDRRINVAEVYLRADRPEIALAVVREWVDAEPENPEARFNLGVFYYELDRLDEAEVELREAFRLDPGHARALNFLGYSLAERKLQLDDALSMIERALEIDAWNGAYLDSLGWVYYQMGRYEDARKPLERAARELPKDPTVLEHLGDLYLGLGKRDEALVAWGRALEGRPENPEQLRAKVARERAADDEAAGETQPLEGRLDVPSLPPQR